MFRNRYWLPLVLLFVLLGCQDAPVVTTSTPTEVAAISPIPPTDTVSPTESTPSLTPTPAATPTVAGTPTELPNPRPVETATPTITPTPTPLMLTVALVEVTVRQGPGSDYLLAELTEQEQGETVSVMGRSEDGQWLKLDGEVGWVSADLLPIDDAPINTLPVAEAPPTTLVTADRETNIREGPDIAYFIDGSAEPNSEFFILGQNATMEWWQIGETPNEVRGWIAQRIVTANGPTDAIPVVPDPPLSRP